MVRICNTPYLSDSPYNSYFESYPYPLSDFQKYAIEAIIKGQHTLVTAHTGSGKTLPAEFAIRHFTYLGKKVIYTSPIKALSNQKFYEFTNKYPDIRFGLFTGDIKTNPNADVLIMTTEILMNYLFVNDSTNDSGVSESSSQLQFQIDIQKELSCVIFDEVHYINDADRGQVWEQTILMLPKHIQMVMLSATIDQPERFAEWCERSSSDELYKKQVYLVSTNHRVVPLTHYSFLTTIELIYKREKDKEIQKTIRESTNKLITLQTHTGQFQETAVHQINKINGLFERHNVFLKRKSVLNNLTEHLKQNEMLPAIAFVFSRKNVELFANEITTNLLEDDSKIPYTVSRDCEQIIRKFPNFKEYLELPEYHQLVKLLERGIGIHHSGMIPVLREIVEIMISKKYIKLLFATESFAIGLDCPIKTAIFTSLTKFDGQNMRFLMSHEYTQMAGRAGRRGIDMVGHVIHCNQLFQNNHPSVNEYKTVLSGKPQQLVSKFHIHYGVILNMLKTVEERTVDELCDFVEKSMLSREIADSLSGIQKQIADLKSQLIIKESSLKMNKMDIDRCKRAVELQDSIPMLVNKKRKDAEREIKSLKDDYRTFEQDLVRYKEYISVYEEINVEESRYGSTAKYIRRHIENILIVLEKYGMVERNSGKSIDTIRLSNSGTSIDTIRLSNSGTSIDTIRLSNSGTSIDTIRLSNSGKIATNIAEIHPIIAATIISKWDFMKDFTERQLVQLMIAFTDIRVPEDIRKFKYHSENVFMKEKIDEIREMIDGFDILESSLDLNTGIQYESILNYDLIDEIVGWIDSSTEEECKHFIQTTIYEKGLSIGDFTKAILKVSTITKEWMNVAERMGNVEFLHKLSQIDKSILKYITTAQSLYV
jgi:superfamily II RNA helicase